MAADFNCINPNTSRPISGHGEDPSLGFASLDELRDQPLSRPRYTAGPLLIEILVRDVIGDVQGVMQDAADDDDAVVDAIDEQMTRCIHARQPGPVPARAKMPGANSRPDIRSESAPRSGRVGSDISDGRGK